MTHALVAGFGFREQTSGPALEQALELALEHALRAAQDGQPAPLRLQALATADDKCGHPALVQLAATLGLPVQAVALERLREQPAQASNRVPGRYGARSLAESAALAAAGAGAVLLAPRQISPDGTATAAIAFCSPDRTSA